MALIDCPECSKSISDQSISCPNCGFPTKLQSYSPPPLPKAKPSPSRQLKKHKESRYIDNTGMFIISCIIIYFISKDDIDYILQHVIGLFSR